jgi:NAD(P)H dehydrogenase (quinone)
MTKLAVIYYSATGHGTTMAQHIANAGERAGAEVRVRHIAETHDPTSFAQIPPGPATTTQPRTSPPQVETTSCGPTP